MTIKATDVIEEGDWELPFALGWMTSIGALPHTDAVHAAEVVLSTQPDLPAIPSLPKRSALEGLLPQALWGVRGVEIDGDGVISVEPGRIDPDAGLGDADLEGEPFVGLRTFCEVATGRTEPVKVQLAGPVTLGLALTMYGVEESVAFAAARQIVSARVQSMIRRVRATLPGAPVVAFLNEPALVGTAQSGFPLATDAIIDLVSGVLATIEHEVVTGVHCCGEADWKAILEAGPRILSLPVGARIDAALGTVSAFLDVGGWIAWGAVPTSAPVGEHAGLYWKSLSAQWCTLVQQGADPVLIRRRSLITPHCGLAEHEVEQAEHVLRLCSLVAASLQEQAVSVKLSVGA